MSTNKREVVQFIERNGWQWGFVNHPTPPVKRMTHFRYGSLELLRPRITVHYE